MDLIALFFVFAPLPAGLMLLRISLRYKRPHDLRYVHIFSMVFALVFAAILIYFEVRGFGWSIYLLGFILALIFIIAPVFIILYILLALSERRFLPILWNLLISVPLLIIAASDNWALAFDNIFVYYIYITISFVMIFIGIDQRHEERKIARENKNPQ